MGNVAKAAFSLTAEEREFLIEAIAQTHDNVWDADKCFHCLLCQCLEILKDAYDTNGKHGKHGKHEREGAKP